MNTAFLTAICFLYRHTAQLHLPKFRTVLNTLYNMFSIQDTSLDSLLTPIYENPPLATSLNFPPIIRNSFTYARYRHNTVELQSYTINLTLSAEGSKLALTAQSREFPSLSSSGSGAGKEKEEEEESAAHEGMMDAEKEKKEEDMGIEGNEAEQDDDQDGFSEGASEASFC